MECRSSALLFYPRSFSLENWFTWAGDPRTDPSIFITVNKAAVFTIFYLMFHVLEEGVRGALHGKGFLPAIQEETFTSVGGLVARLLFVFFTFIPFFALMETRRAMGMDRFRELFLGSAHHRNTPGKPLHDEQPIGGEHRRAS